MRFNVCLLAGVLACCCGASQAQNEAQMGMAHKTVPAGTAVDPAHAQEALLNTFEHELMGVVEAMPADKFNFAPSQGAIAGSRFDGVRTFAQEATHIASANYFFFSGFGLPKPSVDMKALNGLTSKDQVIAALRDSFAYAHKAVASITPANAYTAIADVDGMNTRATVASFAVAHGFDHYGQMVEYLRLNGIVPPGSK